MTEFGIVDDMRVARHSLCGANGKRECVRIQKQKRLQNENTKGIGVPGTLPSLF